MELNPQTSPFAVQQMPLRVPDAKTFFVKPDASPVVRTNQAHLIVRHDREAATIAGLWSSGSTMPKLGRANARQTAVADANSYEQRKLHEISMAYRGVLSMRIIV